MPDTMVLLFLSESPQDDVLWHLLAAQYAEADDLNTAAFIKRDYEMIRRLLRGTFADLIAIRNEAKKVNAEAVALIDRLIPLLRREMTRKVRAQADPPPLPARK